MNTATVLGMKVYSSWKERVFSVDGLESGLYLGMLVTALLVPLLARRRPHSPYFSGTFVLALCPFVFAAVVALIRIHSLIAYEDNTPDYVFERLHFPLALLIFGGVLSLFSVTVYSTIRTVRRVNTPPTAKPISISPPTS